MLGILFSLFNDIVSDESNGIQLKMVIKKSRETFKMSLFSASYPLARFFFYKKLLFV